MKLLVFLTFISFSLNAKEYVFEFFNEFGSLNDKAPEYVEEIKNIDFQNPSNKVILKFPNGKEILIKDYIGAGGNTAIFKISVNGKTFALRVPYTNISMMREYIKGRFALASQKINVPDVYSSGKLNTTPLYIITDYVDFDYNLKSFIKDYKDISKTEIHVMKSELIKFAKQSANFGKIGDFGYDQIVFDRENKKWVLLDWDSDHYFSNSPKANLFTEDYFIEAVYQKNGKGPLLLDAWQENLRKALEFVVSMERKKLNLSGRSKCMIDHIIDMRGQLFKLD